MHLLYSRNDNKCAHFYFHHCACRDCWLYNICFSICFVRNRPRRIGVRKHDTRRGCGRGGLWVVSVREWFAVRGESVHRRNCRTNVLRRPHKHECGWVIVCTRIKSPLEFPKTPTHAYTIIRAHVTKPKQKIRLHSLDGVQGGSVSVSFQAYYVLPVHTYRRRLCVSAFESGRRVGGRS